ncbi:MAG: D-aminoacyl-tRNA deacylase [Schleiferiaceae bacterium]|jgi:D-tyrosyl-tRNA(Tyr) deacylase|nr:D-aminoacyl-tRNA deacylase [Schleiferiaceae bacterium]
MRIVAQKVTQAKVEVEGKVVGEIGKGLMILLGIEHDDLEEDADWLVGKISKMRLFKDHEGIMNLSVKDVQGDFLVVSQFTLHASTKKGNRPSYYKAAKADHATHLYEYFMEKLWMESGRPVQSGKFGAMMDVSLINHGPVTIIIDSKNKE